MQKGDFDYTYFRALSQLVINKASDLDIWGAVFDFTNTVIRVTPPRSIAPSRDDTPIARAFLSFAGSEQTRRNTEHEFCCEIRDYTFRDVEGFFNKHFKEQSWGRENRRIFSAIKVQHKSGQWKDFPNPPEQAAV